MMNRLLALLAVLGAALALCQAIEMEKRCPPNALASGACKGEMLQEIRKRCPPNAMASGACKGLLEVLLREKRDAAEKVQKRCPPNAMASGACKPDYS